ncbi:Tryptase gamma, partial [Massospora cicadina]
MRRLAVFGLSWLALGQESRIVGGVEVKPAFKYPWMVAIFRYGEYWCGGTLVAEDLVVTAAHCMGGAKGPLRNFEVQLHRHNLDRLSQEEDAKLFKVIKRWIVPEFDAETLYNDAHVGGIGSSARSPRGFRVAAIGWGALGELQPNHPILQEVWLPIADSRRCARAYLTALNYTVLPSQVRRIP